MSGSKPFGGEWPALGDEVVSLRPFSQRDVPAMMAWNADVEAQRWFDWPADVPGDPSLHRAHCLQVIARWHADWTAGRRAPFAVHALAGGETVGSVELRVEEGEWHISYLTHPDWRGRGLASRAVRLVCAWAFNELDADQIRLTVAETNESSRALATRVGFVATRILEEPEVITRFEPELGARRRIVEYLLTPQRLAVSS